MTSSGPRTSGLRVFDEAGREVGVVQRVVFGPGQDRLEITTGDGASFEVLFVDELVPVVDLGADASRSTRSRADRTRVSTTRTALN